MNVPSSSSLERRAQLLLGVHHDRTAPGNRLSEWATGHEQEACRHVACRQGTDEFPVTKEHGGSVAGALGLRSRGRILGEAGAPRDDVGEYCVPFYGRVLETCAYRNRHVQILRVGHDALDGSTRAVHLAGNDPDDHSVVGNDPGNLVVSHAPVAGRHHLVCRRQIHPELETLNHTGLVTERHLLMHDPATGRHPLRAPRADRSRVSHAVRVLDIATQQVGDGLDTAVGMPGETLPKVLRFV